MLFFFSDKVKARRDRRAPDRRGRARRKESDKDYDQRGERTAKEIRRRVGGRGGGGARRSRELREGAETVGFKGELLTFRGKAKTGSKLK